MFPLIETAAAFAAVMLVVSLFVSALVQAIQSALGLRAAGLDAMLLSLIHNYGTLHGQSLSGDEERAFVDAIITHPLLHPLRPKALGGAKVARPIEYLDQDDLIDLVKTEMSQPTPGGRAVLKAVVDVTTFTAFVERWYETVGATSSQHFKLRMRRLTLLVSCALVIAFNFDGIRLIADLHRDETERDTLAREIAAIHHTSELLSGEHGEHGDRDATAKAPPAAEPALHELTEELRRTSKILEGSGLGAGWQSSYIVNRWSLALREAHDGGPGERAPTKRELFGDTLLWLVGIVFSCVMLSLGAPFWATTLGSLVNLTNAVQKAKSGPANDPPKSVVTGKVLPGPDSDRSPG
jgi:hypothetical protein